MAEEGEVTSSSEEEIEELLEVRKRQGGGLAAEDKRNESAGEEETGAEGGSETEGEGDRISDEKLKGLSEFKLLVSMTPYLTRIVSLRRKEKLSAFLEVK